MSGDRVEMKILARVETPFEERFGTPRQPGLVPAARGRIVFEEEFRQPDLLRGIEEFSHLWLSFLFDRTMYQGYRPLVRPPRLGGNEKIGVLATRSPFRPNGMGLSAVKLEEVDVESCELIVSGVDLTNGTPLIDIRPYLAYTDSLVDVRCGFAPDAPVELPVQVDEVCAALWEKLEPNQREVIYQTLSLDPSPAYHADPDRVYRVELCGHALAWRKECGVIRLCQLKPISC